LRLPLDTAPRPPEKDAIISAPSPRISFKYGDYS
jgi:hypothetical protein